MLWHFLKGILGNYKGEQRTKQIHPIVEASPVATVENVLQIPAVWSCVNLIVNTFKSLPIDVLRVSEDGKKTLEKNHYLYQLLNFEPNQEMTPSEFKSVMCLNYLLSGNAFAKINRSAAGNYILSLFPLNAEMGEWLDMNITPRMMKSRRFLRKICFTGKGSGTASPGFQ